MRILIGVSLLLNVWLGFGQQNFVPADTLSTACAVSLDQEYKQKFEAINKNISIKNTAERKLTKEIYNEVQEEFLDKIASNDFICNDDINLYLNGLLQEVLVRNNIASADYKILLSRDSEANAYNTGDGTVVLNYGLFLWVENEDELVFVIAHEIGHQELQHVRKEIEVFSKLSTSEAIVAQTKEIRRQKYGKATKANNLLKGIRYQSYDTRRRKEIEADSIGLIFYQKTTRNPKAGIHLLEKLDHVDVEADSLAVSDYKAIFGKDGFVVKQKYFEEEASLFSKYDFGKEVDKDSLKSHPDCTMRIELIEKYTGEKYGGDFSTSETFSKIKSKSVYQNLFNLFAAEKYGLSLYEALKLYKYNDQDAVLQKIIYLNLVKIHESRVNYTINRFVPAHDNLKHTKSLNRFVSFVNNIKLSDFEILINRFKS